MNRAFLNRGRKEKSMSIQERLAMKVMKLANESTKWNFQITSSGDSYYVESVVTSPREERTLIVSFVLKSEYVLLKVWSPNSRYDDGFVYDKLCELSCRNAIVSEYGIYSTIFGETGICFNSPIPLDVLENETGSVVRKLMIEMISVVAEVICYSN